MIGSALLMTVGLAATPDSKATQRPLESLEWLCLRSDLVVVGQIVSAADLAGGGKSRGLRSFRLEGYDLRSPERSGTYGIAVRDVSLEVLEELQEAETRLVVFLRRTEQAFSFDGRTMNLWPLHKADGGSWAVPVGVSDAPLVSAKSLSVVYEPDALAQICSAHQRDPTVPQFVEPPKAFVALPTSAPAAQVLGPRAPAHLLVPAASFPEASTQSP